MIRQRWVVVKNISDNRDFNYRLIWWQLVYYEIRFFILDYLFFKVNITLLGFDLNMIRSEKLGTHYVYWTELDFISGIFYCYKKKENGKF